MALVSCNAIELDERHFDFGVSRNDGQQRRGTVAGQEKIVHHSDSGVEPLAIASGAVIGDGALQHVAQTVELVAGLLRFGRHAEGRAIADEVSVQVAVGFLHGYHKVDDVFGGFAQLGAISGLQGEGHRFGPFVYVGIGIYCADLRSAALADQSAEIVHAPMGFFQVVHGRNALRDVDFAARGPETGLDGDGADGNAVELCVWRIGKIQNALVLPRPRWKLISDGRHGRGLRAGACRAARRSRGKS